MSSRITFEHILSDHTRETTPILIDDQSRVQVCPKITKNRKIKKVHLKIPKIVLKVQNPISKFVRKPSLFTSLCKLLASCQHFTRKC